MGKAGQGRWRDAALPGPLHGHASIDSTYYYIHTSPDFLRDYDHLMAGSRSLLPEVGFA